MLGLSDKMKKSIVNHLDDAGFEGTDEVVMLARDFVDRPEIFSDVLRNDFEFSPILSHRIRAVAMNALQSEQQRRQGGINTGSPKVLKNNAPTNGVGPSLETVQQQGHHPDVSLQQDTSKMDNNEIDDNGDSNSNSLEGTSLDSATENTKEEEEDKPSFKSFVVNDRAARRKQGGGNEYGLPSNYKDIYPALADEIDKFVAFMTVPSTISQEAPIRHATAEVYVRHAKLFLGWCVKHKTGGSDRDGNDTCSNPSLYSIIPNKEKESAQIVLDFVLWLRSERQISASYEANLLRGLMKLLKFRFSTESKTDPSYGGKSFDDIPMIRELRKLHREANQKQQHTTRSSVEDRKWLSWSEYLGVAASLKRDLEKQIRQHQEEDNNNNNKDDKRSEDEVRVDPKNNRGPIPKRTASTTKARNVQRKKIATTFQHYLILAFFASVPDRQRTIRELELGTTFIKDRSNGLWTIKHGPDDYKTGKAYGDRPPLVLAPELVPAIDDFVERWRPCLNPKTGYLFVQPRTGNPLSRDSVYQIVARNCFQRTGKKTNPHLLRDMIVTHVRSTEASEKQLEALALYMGHSIQMQRDSYDRRTLTTKVAPAVELLQSTMNSCIDGSTNEDSDS